MGRRPPRSTRTDTRFPYTTVFRAEYIIALPAPAMGEEILSDYRATGLALAAHPLSLLREQLRARRVLGSNDLHGQRHGSSVHAAGIVTQRQRPQAASGT